MGFMIKTLITDVSKVLLFPKDSNYTGSLNTLYKEKSVDGNFSFFDHFALNTELLNYYKSLKGKLKIYILTSDIIQDASELQPYWNEVIDRIFSASKMKTNKSEPEAYKRVIEEIGIDPREAIYIDDNAENINAAKSMGLKTILYHNSMKVKSEIEKLL